MTLSQRKITFFYPFFSDRTPKTLISEKIPTVTTLRSWGWQWVSRQPNYSTLVMRKGNAKVRFQQENFISAKLPPKIIAENSKSIISRINMQLLENENITTVIFYSLAAIQIVCFLTVVRNKNSKRKPNHGRNEWKCGQVAAVLIIKGIGLVSSQSDWRGKRGEHGDAFFFSAHRTSAKLRKLKCPLSLN